MTTKNIYSYGSVTRNSFLNQYTSQYSEMDKSLKIIRENHNLIEGASLKNAMVDKFNRFKIAFPDSELGKTFDHVFFTRPDLNLYTSSAGKLTAQAEQDPMYYYLNKTDKNLLLSLTRYFSANHDFIPFLSNKVGSFELGDDYIKTEEYGETFTGYKMKFGKNNIESKTAGSFSISYRDDSELRIYKMHKAWTDYISKVYRGEFKAKDEYIRERILDYAVSVYYFLCGPDGETILFWSKYTGVFPTNNPASAASWSKGNVASNPEYSISYDYSWKEDFNPVSLAEFNKNSKQDSVYKYASIYEPLLSSTGRTFTNAPFVETTTDKNTGYTFKLKFRAP